MVISQEELAEEQRIREEKLAEEQRIQEERRRIQAENEKRIHRKKIIWGVVGGIVGAAAIGGTIGWYVLQLNNH